MPPNFNIDNNNIIATQLCQTVNEYSSSTLSTSTTYCYKPLDIWIMYFIDFIIIFPIIILTYLGVKKYIINK